MKEEIRRKRHQKVLEIIVRNYTIETEPVSSGLIARHLGLSSATVRHIMMELEELGLIRQPHISAGRVPTNKGYRTYVDSLLELEGFMEFSRGGIDEDLPYLRSGSIEDVISKGLQLCSRLTSQACVALFPTLKIKQHIIEKLEEKARDSLALLYDFTDRLYLDGTHYLVEQPEFKEAAKIGSVLKILEDKKELLQILEEDLKEGGLKIRIGSENSLSEFCECTIITANYNIDDDIPGTLGIIGPMRMEYERVIPTVGRIADSISRFFSETAHSQERT